MRGNVAAVPGLDGQEGAKANPQQKPSHRNMQPRSRPAILGVLMLLAVLLMCVPTTVPRFYGYDVYEVLSESMQPRILAGSAIFVKPIDPALIMKTDVIAFKSEDNVLVRRVALNRPSIGEFVTRADANSIDDPRPVDYDAVIGKVYLSVPVLGRVMTLYTSDRGRWALTGVVAVGAMLVVVGPRMSARYRAWRKRRRKDARRGLALRLVVALLVLVVLAAVGAAGYAWYDLGQSVRGMEEAPERFTQRHPVPGEMAPLSVDFDALRSLNGDVVGWLFCEGTSVSFPVMYSENGLYYQLHSYDNRLGVAGSVWVDTANSPSFGDGRTLVYGPSMVGDYLFAYLAAWEDQGFAASHPTLWLLTPQQDWRIDLVAVCRETPTSVVFENVTETGERLETLVRRIVANTSVSFEGATEPFEGTYISLATHDLVEESERIVLTGRMVPVDSAAGVAL